MLSAAYIAATTFSQDTSPMGLICEAIARDNFDAFAQLLPQIKDPDFDNGRLLRLCVEHNRFSMARKIFEYGGATAPAMVGLRAHFDETVDAYNKKPSGQDAAERAARDRASELMGRLNAWKTCFHDEIMPLLSLKKMDDLHAQIAALREEIAEVISPARNVVKKPTALTKAKP